MKEAYLIIKTGYEGIEQLAFLTEDLKKATKKMEYFHHKIDEIERDVDGWRDENNFIAVRHEKQKKKDWYCLQKWNGREFDCVCKATLSPDYRPNRMMLR